MFRRILVAAAGLAMIGVFATGGATGDGEDNSKHVPLELRIPGGVPVKVEGGVLLQRTAQGVFEVSAPATVRIGDGISLVSTRKPVRFRHGKGKDGATSLYLEAR
jgi:hypothetical protein